jgi:cysteine sulfinate desulfinase/cysteine desulfurase-like protein
VEVQRHKIKESLMGGLYSNIHKKRKRIAKGSKESMRKPGTPGAPTAKAFAKAKKTAKKK